MAKSSEETADTYRKISNLPIVSRMIDEDELIEYKNRYLSNR